MPTFSVPTPISKLNPPQHSRQPFLPVPNHPNSRHHRPPPPQQAPFPTVIAHPTVSCSVPAIPLNALTAHSSWINHA